MPMMDPIQIKPRDAGRLIMLFPYSSDRAEKIKMLAGRRCHQQEQHWTVPKTNEAVTHLLTLYAGELSYATAFVCHTSPGRRQP